MSELVGIPPDRLRAIDYIWQAAVALRLNLDQILNDAEIVVIRDDSEDQKVESAFGRYVTLYNRVLQERSTEGDVKNLELILITLAQAIAENVTN